VVGFWRSPLLSVFFRSIYGHHSCRSQGLIVIVLLLPLDSSMPGFIASSLVSAESSLGLHNRCPAVLARDFRLASCMRIRSSRTAVATTVSISRHRGPVSRSGLDEINGRYRLFSVSPISIGRSIRGFRLVVVVIGVIVALGI